MLLRHLSLATGLCFVMAACGDSATSSDTQADSTADALFETTPDALPGDTQADTTPDTTPPDTQVDTSVDTTPDTTPGETQADTTPGDTQVDTTADTSADGAADADVAGIESACNDQVDEDDDGDTDCADVDCAAACTPTALRLVTFSDWHGQLDPTTVTIDGTTTPPTTKSLGGAAVLSTYFAKERADEANTLVLTAGDAFGGTPPLSAFYDDEPAIDALNLMGIDADTFGNHNFDHGLAYMQHLIDRAEYPYVSANLSNLAANLQHVHSPYVIVEVGATKVALIGLTNPDAADLTFPGNMGTMVVQDPATQARAARTAAAAEGATVFVLLVHMGATGGTTEAPTGPLIDFAESVTGFQVIVGDHTDFPTQQVINGQLVVENKSKGLSFARIDLTVVPATGEVTASTATFVEPVWQTNGPAGLVTVVTPDVAIDALLQPLRDGLSEVNDMPIGTTSAVFERDGTKERLQEVPLGDLVCDAFRDRYATQLCFLNGGGLRAPLPSTYAPADLGLRRPGAGYAAGPPYDIVIGDIYAVQPFGNVVVTRTVTGAQLFAMLEHGFSSLPAKAGFFPQIGGFEVVYDVEAAVGSRVVSVKLKGGAAILANATTYTLATTNFLNAGGDGYTMLADGLGTTREVDALVLQEYVEHQQATLVPATDGRIVENGTVVPTGPAVASVTVAGAPTMDVVSGGGTGVFTVTLAAPATAGGTVVTLTSAAGAVVQVPASVTVVAGATSATFRVKAVGAGAQAGVSVTATTSGGAASGTVNVVLTGIAPGVGSLVINEVNFDPPGDDAATSGALEGDYNCDGAAPAATEFADEFIELVNTTNKSIVLDGVAIWDANSFSGTTPTYTIAAGVTIGPGEPLVIVGGALATTGTSPWCAGVAAGHIGDARALGVAASPGLSLNNGGDDLYVTASNNPESVLLDGVTWGSGVTAKESQVLSPEVVGTAYMNHAAMAGALALPYTATPGTYASGRKFADAQ